MESSTNTSPSTPINVLEIINNIMIAHLEAGIIPWQQPWHNGDMPRNMISNRPYGGINLWSLLAGRYERNLFLSWDQIKAAGGSVIKGETGHVIIYWSRREGTADKKPKSQLRYYKVFNIAQCVDIRPDLIPPTDEPDGDHVSALDICEGIVSHYAGCPQIVHKGKTMNYDVQKNIITVPPKKHFKDPALYFNSLFKPLISSTGSEGRLNRKSFKELTLFKEEQLGMEALVAEMGSSFLCSTAGILPQQSEDPRTHAQLWLPLFKIQTRFMIQAARQAQRAADYILNRKEEEVTDDEEEAKGESVVQ